MRVIKSYISKKIVMAITALIMLFYLIAHLLGNLLIFKGPSGINAYAMTLREFGLLLWTIRIIMFVAFLIHLIFAIQLTIENKKARPLSYKSKKNLRSTFASRNMIWTGVIIALYLIYHLLNFTFPVINSTFSRNIDVLQRPDIFSMVFMNFKKSDVYIIYATGLIALGLHLSHGVQSLFQTLGLNNEYTLPVMVKAAIVVSLILLIGFLSIPTSISTGLLRYKI
ncbi:MAG: succinate dehydrogenase cytochrome b subunit [Thermodesulfovibrionales bacterium]